jgi:phosphohistidine swiveling domain-containing protein
MPGGRDVSGLRETRHIFYNFLMDEPLIIPLDAPDVPFELAGGKGASLVRLIRSGFPVPGGFVVTTAAYRDYVAANNLGRFILQMANATPARDPVALEAASEAIRDRFALGHIPASLSRELRATYGALEISSIAVAVRSSATAEDLPELSFAGQQDTFLNVVGEEALLRAVVDCWSSLWTARAIGYRARSGIPHEGIALAVVVQSMVQSEISGVLFTANPLSGRRLETVIEAVRGLGDALVSGRVKPETYVVGPSGDCGLPIADCELSIENRSASLGPASLLPDDTILTLVAVGRQVETFAGWPQDIEWAWADGQLWLLQARPITSLYPLPEGMPSEPLQVLVSFGAVQGILEPITPLGRDVICGALAAVANLFDRDGRVNHATQRIAVSAGERLFLNITGAMRHGTARRITRAVPSFVEPALGQAMAALWDDPRLAPASGGIRPRTLWRLAPVLLPVVRRFIAGLARPDTGREQAKRAIEGVVARAEARAATVSTLAEGLALFDEVLEALPQALFGRWFPAFAPGMAALNLLMRLSAPIPGGRALALEITRGLPHNVTTEMDLALWDVARAIRADPAALTRFRASEAPALAADLLGRRLPRTAREPLERFLARYGMRGVGEIDLGRPRWREDPTPVIQAVRSYLGIEDPEQAPDAVFARGAASAAKAIERLCGELRAQRRGWARARLARWAARRVRALAGLRESPKFAIVRVLGILRESLMAAGQELAVAGVIPAAGDIFFLRLDELYGLAAGGENALASDLRETIAVRRERYASEMRRRQIPRLLLSDGQAFYEGMASPEEAGEGVLVGSPVSPGVAEGPVRVILDPCGASLAPGEILVCRGTDPAWTPLFLAAGGLVSEVGGLMTHGAVVAREYGIPAVVGVTGATTRLVTGQRVRVDGTGGRVTVL